MDEFDRVSEVENHQGDKNNYLYDFRDNVIAIVDPLLNSTNFYFDFENRRQCKEDPTVGVVSYNYNNDNLVINKTEYDYFSGASCSNLAGNYREINYSYDGLGRITLKDYGAGASASNIVYNYDGPSSLYGVGKLTSVNYGSGSKSYSYNIYDSISSETQVISPNTYTTQFNREVSGRLSSIIYPEINSSTLEVFYNYGDNNQVSSINYIKNGSLATSLINNVSYNEFNKLSQINRASGIVETFNYNTLDKSYRLQTLNISNSNSDLLNFSYSYDSTSKIIGIDESVNSSSEQFFYDSLNRLKDYFLNSVKKRSYNYDSIGNILSKKVDAVEKNYTYEQGRSQALSSYDGQLYNFDGFGNLSTIGQKIFSFDESNRLLSYSNGVTATDYDYDHENMRTSKSLNGIVSNEYIAKYAETKNGEPIYHIYLRDQRVASFDSTGSLNHIHKNHQDSAVLRTNEAGIEVFNQKYFPFGESRSGSSLLGDLNNLFTDQYFDNESEIYYYKNRYYLQEVGRFASADQLYLEEMNTRGVRPLEMNVYSYVGNDPVNMVDPSGNFLERIFTGDLTKNSENAVTYSQFIESTKGKDFDDIVRSNQSISSASAAGPDQSIRFVKDPANSENIIDMRHFLVVGKMGETAGLGIEILQSLSNSKGAKESAFDPQDFFSNALGAEFYSDFKESEPMDTQLNEFFTDRANGTSGD